MRRFAVITSEPAVTSREEVSPMNAVSRWALPRVLTVGD
jgi:hypothetical protein